MSYRKTALLSSSSTQSCKSKSKGFFNCIAKSLFNCKSSRRYISSDYEFIGYGSCTTQSTSEFDCTLPRAASTMIDSLILKSDEIFPDKTTTSEFTFNQTGQAKDVSIYISDEQLRDQFLQEETLVPSYVCLGETELSRRVSDNSFNSRFITADEITIVRKSTSPVSNFREDPTTQSRSHLHSTKLSNYNSLPSIASPTRSRPRASLESTSTSSGSSVSSVDLSIDNEHVNLIDTIIHNVSQAQSATHACVQDYEATFVDDVSVSFSDTLQIIRDDNEEWIYVQLSSDGRKGFVPREIVTNLDNFISQLMQHKNVHSSVNYPVDV